MKIQIDPHTLERAKERGTNEDEIKDVVYTGVAIPAKHGQTGKAKVYEFMKKRHGKYYKQKMVEVIYTVEKNIAVTVTTYVFYGKWESKK